MYPLLRMTGCVAERGFIALMATIIIGAMMLLLTATLARSGYAVRAQVLAMEQKALSRSVAEGCVLSALMDRLADSAYAGGTSVPVGAGTCDIAPLEYDDAQRFLTIRVQGVVAYSYTTLEYIYDLQAIHQGTTPLDPDTIRDATRLVPLPVAQRELSVMP